MKFVNPYRDAFYQKQAEWHHYEAADHVRGLHEVRSAYYEWWTRDWLPANRDGKILDIGAGSGQFLYFLKKKGYHHLKGIDLDKTQVGIAKAIGLDVEAASIFDSLEDAQGQYEMIVMLDIIEHFTREELYPLMETVVRSLRPGGRVIASVPNAESPDGLRLVYADITHEIAFTPMSFEEMLFCHGLKLASLRRSMAVAHRDQATNLSRDRSSVTGAGINPAPRPRFRAPANLVERDVGAGAKKRIVKKSRRANIARGSRVSHGTRHDGKVTRTDMSLTVQRPE